MMKFNAPVAFAAALFAASALSACDRGSAERAGERADSAFEQATGGSIDRSDGPMENAGEAIDDAAADLSEAAKDAQRSMEGAAQRATDNNTNTHP